MKALKKSVCIILVFAAVIGLTSCTSKSFEHKKFAAFCEKQGFEEYDDTEDFLKALGNVYMGKEESCYISYTNDDAQELHNHVNRLWGLPEYDVEEISIFGYKSEEDYSLAQLLTFKDEKEAGKYFKRYAKLYSSNGEKGEQNGYSYSIKCTASVRAGQTDTVGVYLKGNTVLIINSYGTDFELIEAYCKYFHVISPVKD